METIGERVRNARLAKGGWSQTRLGNAVGLKQQTISKLENGGSATTGELYQISIVLGVRYDYLKTGDLPMVSDNPFIDISPGQFIDAFASLPADQQADLFSEMARVLASRRREPPDNGATGNP